MSRRWFWLAAASLLATMAALEVTSARLENQTADEAVHLVSGYSILRQGRFSLNAENPPVSKTLSALPLLWLHPDLPASRADDWQAENTVAISAPFLYRNRLPADEILFWGRLPTMLLTLAFGAVLAAWMRFRFGAGPALFALALYCFDPNFIAHGRYVTSDVYGASFFFLGCIAWGEFLLQRRMRWAVAASLITAVGICSKFNLLLLPIVVVVLSLWGQGFCPAAGLMPGVSRSKHLARTPQAILLYFLLIPPAIWAIYGFELRTAASDAPIDRFFRMTPAELTASPVLPKPAIALLDPSREPGSAIHWAAYQVPIPAYSFFKGLYRLYNHDYWGHPAYLLGQVSTHGWWWYFPLAFLVKTPTGTLLLLILAAVSARCWRLSKYPVSFLLLPAAIYFAAAMAGRIDIGVRHILPVYPFLYCTIGLLAFTPVGQGFGPAAGLSPGAESPHVLYRGGSQPSALRRNVAVFALALTAFESLAIYPNYLAFFNLPSGGPSRGANYLVDSNLDWGQNALELQHYLHRNHIPRIALEYFGSADLSYYGVSSDPLESALRQPTRRIVAISATALEMNPQFAPLRKCPPIDRVGYSIYIYDLNSSSCPVVR